MLKNIDIRYLVQIEKNIARAKYPTFKKQKLNLISYTIIKENKLDVSDEKLRASLKEEVSRYFDTT